jgi:hypothetical protein
VEDENAGLAVVDGAANVVDHLFALAQHDAG